MSFGISGHPERTQMVGGDVAVAYINQTTLRGCAEDYYLDAKSQCAGDHGACPDDRLAVSTQHTLLPPLTFAIRFLNNFLMDFYPFFLFFLGEHEFCPSSERGASERVLDSDVPAATARRGPARPARVHQHQPADHLGHRPAQRGSTGLLPPPLQ